MDLERFCSNRLCCWCGGSGGRWSDDVYRGCYACEGSGLIGGRKTALHAIEIWKRERAENEKSKGP